MHKKIFKREEGQSLIVVGFAIITLVGFVGLAVDLGLAYVERVRVRRAADAAALAAASELPLESTAHLRALELLEENQYGCDLVPVGQDFQCSNPNVRVEINGSHLWGPGADEAEKVIVLNTADYRNEGQLNTASKIRVEVTSDAALYFMRVFNFFKIPIMGRAVAENINNIDVAIVFDRSGSMEFDTLCYGCWTEEGDEYPGGRVYPLPWGPDPAGVATHCSGNNPLQYDGHTYYIIEAEEYSRSNVPYNRQTYSFGKTYWVIQRNGSQAEGYMRHGNGAGAYGRDSYGAYIQHMPARQGIGPGNDGPGVSCRWEDVSSSGLCRTIGQHSNDPFPFGNPFPAPRVDYDFEIPNSGPWYIWIRAQASNQGQNVFWGLDGNVIGRRELPYRNSGNYYDGAQYDDWGWRRLAPGYNGDQNNAGQSLSAGRHTLHLWAGDPNFAVDRIIITDNPDNPAAYYDDNRNGTYGENDIGPLPEYATLVNNVMESNHFDNNRTDWACDPCDARFGGSPQNDPLRATENLDTPYCEAAQAPQPYRYLDDIYDDEQPIRASVEAAKNFIKMMDFKFDQVGLASYSTNARLDSELQCLRRLGDNCTPDVITNTVIADLNALRASGSTNIGDGIRKGIQILSTQAGHYGRPGAAHIMVLMTDGQANQSYSECLAHLDENDPSTWLWPDHNDAENYWKGKECAMHEAYRALDNGIVIYGISLGTNADFELLDRIAKLTGGVHRNAPRPEQLEPIFEELYKRIFLRLVE
ncbi:MAG: VWA domain-containing protein [Anaerolineae bacterium]